MKMSVGRVYEKFKSSDGIHDINYFYMRDYNGAEKPRAIIQLEHGIAEHIERYYMFGYELSKAGFVVFANDHLGHGKLVTDENEQCWFSKKNGWEHVCNDVWKLHDIAVNLFPGIPYILMGHSMGSFIVRTVVLSHSEDIDGLVLSGTGHQNGLMIKGGKFLSAIEKAIIGSKGKSKIIDMVEFEGYRKSFSPRRTDFDWLSRDEYEVDKYIKDPLCGNPVSVGLFRDMLSGLDIIRKPKNIEKIRKDIPIYMFSGASDPVGQMSKGTKKVYDLYKSAGINDVTLRLYENGRHEMLNGPDRKQVMAELIEWLNKKIEQ